MAFYDFRCKKCNKEFEIEIPMKEYDKAKNEQVCPDCNEKLERVLKPIGDPVYECGGFYCKE